MDAAARREIHKFVETASVRQLEEKRVEISILKASLTDAEVIRDADWILEQIALEQWARIESGVTPAEHITLETPKNQK